MNSGVLQRELADCNYKRALAIVKAIANANQKQYVHAQARLRNEVATDEKQRKLMMRRATRIDKHVARILNE